MTTTKTSKWLEGATAQDVEDVVRDLAREILKREDLMLQMEGRITEIRESYKGRLLTCDEKIAGMKDLAEQWARQWQAGRPATKSVQLTHGVIGFRVGNPQLKLLKGWTWRKALEAVKAKMAMYVRVREELNKEQILADRAILKETGKLEVCGMKIHQDETFFVEPKRESGPAPTAG